MESLKTRKKLDYFHICRQIHTEISGNFAGTISVTVAKMAKQCLANWRALLMCERGNLICIVVI